MPWCLKTFCKRSYTKNSFEAWVQKLEKIVKKNPEYLKVHIFYEEVKRTKNYAGGGHQMTKFTKIKF